MAADKVNDNIDNNDFGLVDYDEDEIDETIKFQSQTARTGHSAHSSHTNPEKKQKSMHIKDPHVKIHNYFLKQFACVNIILNSNLNVRQLLNYNASDKVIIPPGSFHELANISKESVYVLRVTNPKNFNQVYVTVEDYTSSDKTGKILYIPPWIMKHLDIKNNEMVHADAVSVPKITEVQIKVPDDIKAAEVNIKVIIEFLLRNHTLLFLGKRLSYQMFSKEFVFEVVHLKPSHVGIIANSDVRLDIV